MMTLEQLMSSLKNLPVWPVHLHGLLASLDKEDMNVTELAEKLVGEQAIVARLLRVANSPFYGTSGKISNPTQAINVVGISNTRAIVIAASVMSKMPASQLEHFDTKSFWKEAMTGALIAQSIAIKLNISSNDAFTAGILRDIGQLILADACPDQYALLWPGSMSGKDALRARELATFGFDHTEVGAALAKKWNFPPALVDSLRWHHNPEQGDSVHARILWIADHVIETANCPTDEAAQMIELVCTELGLDKFDWKSTALNAAKRVQALEGIL